MATSAGRVLSVNVGTVRAFEYGDRPDRSVDLLLDAVREKGARPNRYTGKARKT
jgi:hypothetical protein